MHHDHHQPAFDSWSIVSPGVLLITILLGVGYFLLIGPWRQKRGYEETPSLWKKRGFVIGLAVFYFALGPVNTFAHDSFSAHMMEMALVYMVVPPLILLGLPSWVYRPLWSTPKRGKLFRFVTYPLVTLVIFNGFFSMYHLPVVFDTIMASSVLMAVSHIVLGIAAFMMWWPLTCPVPEKDRLNPLQKLGYIIGDSILITPACALIAFSDVLMYQAFQEAPVAFTFLGALDDQQMGAVVMKIIQEGAYGAVLGYTFYQWVKEHKRKEQEEAESIQPRGENGDTSTMVY
ncbi:cytochrome c oxidase assembly protein [Desmospora activa]|uniref:Putative membrane protein n=1 Tax=Desmospora activa DSM 45169 TaxID=1121389 RepID=A0A2T4Z3G8_9BACL|nr:cytochrome c oxidase assembly protein [Desmospora activa]PTM56438.1 putative membrane protein [Desmospora activa DSM 45169]